MKKLNLIMTLKKHKGSTKWVNLKIFCPETGGYEERGRATEAELMRDLLLYPYHSHEKHEIRLVSNNEFEKIIQKTKAA